MEIVGIGTEIVECLRIGHMIEKHGELFLARVFTPRELRRCWEHKKSTEFFAAYWASKEATLKALGIASVRKLTWAEMEIVQEGRRQPEVRLHGAIKERAAKQGVGRILLAYAHCRAYATAYVLVIAK